MVLWGGVNIAPREIEEVLYQHPEVVDCAVFGIPDERDGEHLKAMVQLRHPVATDELATTCGIGWPATRCPTCGRSSTSCRGTRTGRCSSDCYVSPTPRRPDRGERRMRRSGRRHGTMVATPNRSKGPTCPLPSPKSTRPCRRPPVAGSTLTARRRCHGLYWMPTRRSSSRCGRSWRPRDGSASTSPSAGGGRGTGFSSWPWYSSRPAGPCCPGRS